MIKIAIGFAVGFSLGFYVVTSRHNFTQFENQTLNFIEISYVNGCVANTVTDYDLCLHNAKEYRNEIEDLYRNKAWN